VQTLSALRIGRLYPQEIFLLEAESTSGPQCGLKDYVNDTIGNRTRDLPAGIAVPQPTATPHAPETVVILWIAVPYIVDCGTVYCGLRYRILWIALPYIVDCVAVYCGLRYRILWIAVPYIVDYGAVYCGLRYRILWIAVPYILDCGAVYCILVDR